VTSEHSIAPTHGYEGYQKRQQRAVAEAKARAVPEHSPFPGAATELRERIEKRVNDLTPRLFQLAESLFAEPEIAFQEHKSVRKLAALVGEFGIEAEIGSYGLPTALHAHAGKSTGPQFAFISEYDALPGLGHACGHNLIAAIGAGGFLALASVIEELDGGVHLIGTPAEEGGAGKQYIVEAGGFGGISAAAMVHPGNVNRAFGRGVGLRHVHVVYHGRAAHAGAAPHLGLNALDGVVAGYQAVAYLRQHILPTDRIHGVITDGGEAPNVVPKRAAAHFFVRSADLDTLDLLVNRVVAALEGAALSTGTRAEIKLDAEPPYYPLQPNDALLTRFVTNLGGRREFNPRSTATIGAGSTDMGNVSQVVPAIHPNLQICPPNVSTHTAAFPPYTRTPEGEAAIRDGALGLALTAVDFLSDAEFRAEVRRQFDAFKAAS
jgi:amidohydrolase